MGVGTPPIAHAEPNRIRVEYVLPSNPAHQALYEMLQERRALEKFQEIFSPFRLPIVLTLKTVGCDGVSNAYYQRPELKICYEYLDDIRKSMPKETTEAGVTPMDAVVGQFFYAVAHEMGHAVFDMYDVPLFGRPEDAADQFAAYIMLQFGKDQARRLIGGAAYSYKNFVHDPKYVVSLEAFSNTHGAPAQRFYNLLCIAYGADSKLFADVVEKGYLPQKRAATCRAEYREVAFAFKQLISPHLDQELMKQALDKAWMPEPGPSSVHK
jgi:Putative metallopeptidase